MPEPTAAELAAAQRQLLRALKAQADDLGQEVADLRRQLTALQRAVQDLQRAHNALAGQA